MSIKAFRQLSDSLIAVFGNVIQDRAHISGNVAFLGSLGFDQTVEPGGEVWRGIMQSVGHGLGNIPKRALAGLIRCIGDLMHWRDFRHPGITEILQGQMKLVDPELDCHIPCKQ